MLVCFRLCVALWGPPGGLVWAKTSPMQTISPGYVQHPRVLKHLKSGIHIQFNMPWNMHQRELYDFHNQHTMSPKGPVLRIFVTRPYIISLDEMFEPQLARFRCACKVQSTKQYWKHKSCWVRYQAGHVVMWNVLLYSNLYHTFSIMLRKCVLNSWQWRPFGALPVWIKYVVRMFYYTVICHTVFPYAA